MAKQTINQGTAPTGAGGDTFRSGSAKLQSNDDEIYNYLGDGKNLNKLGTAATATLTTSDKDEASVGRVIKVGDFGIGHPNDAAYSPSDKPKGGCFGNFLAGVGLGWKDGEHRSFINAGNGGALGFQIIAVSFRGDASTIRIGFRQRLNIGSWDNVTEFITQANTTVDSNGFVKSASPIVKLFADKIELNDEAQQQSIEFEKLGVGDYLIKGSTGFAQDGWYVETPKDANGNLLVAVVYEQLENGDISVKTYDYMLNKKGRIVADTETPLDIPEARWIDLRLQELPQPEIEMPESVTPPEFQPTGLAEAVATVMESYDDTEQ